MNFLIFRNVSVPNGDRTLRVKMSLNNCWEDTECLLAKFSHIQNRSWFRSFSNYTLKLFPEEDLSPLKGQAEGQPEQIICKHKWHLVWKKKKISYMIISKLDFLSLLLSGLAFYFLLYLYNLKSRNLTTFILLKNIQSQHHVWGCVLTRLPSPITSFFPGLPLSLYLEVTSFLGYSFLVPQDTQLPQRATTALTLWPRWRRKTCTKRDEQIQYDNKLFPIP